MPAPSDRTRARVITSPLSLARELWRYGEPELASRALSLSVDEVWDLGARVFDLANSGAADRAWPDGPRNKAYVLAAIEHLEGAPRPPKRARRLPEKRLPPELQATLEQRLAAAEPIGMKVLENPHEA